MSIVLFRFGFFALLVLFFAGVSLMHPRGHFPASRGIETPLAAQQPTLAHTQIVAGEAAAHAQCATCHKFAAPDVLPRSRWRDEIARMYLIQNNQPEPSGPPGTAARIVRLPPDWLSIVGYYEANAPEHLAALATWPEPDQTLPFRKRVVSLASRQSNQAVANIRLVDLDHDGGSRWC